MRGRRPRRLRRRRLAVLPVVAVLVIGAGKFVTMYAFAATGTDAHDEGRYAASATSFARLETLNVVHPWRAYVGLGDARYRQGDLLRAEVAFARALELAPERCATRFNLAVTLEAQGDRLVAGQALVPDGVDQPDVDVPFDAAERYLLALAVVAAGDCPSAQPDDVGDRLTLAQARLIVKLAALGVGDPNPDPEGDDPEPSAESERGDSEQIDNLVQRNEAGAGQREAGRDRNTTGAVPDGQSNW